MSNNEILKVVGIEVPDGGSAQGTNVKLSNGQYLTGIQTITLTANTDTKLWELSLKMTPDFTDQQTIEALLANVELAKKDIAVDRKTVITKEISVLQAELEYLNGIG